MRAGKGNEVQDQFWQFGASLAAILALGAVAWALKLGPEPRLRSEKDARMAADTAIDGYDPCEFSIDREGKAAIMIDRSGAILVLKPHGSHFAGRLLGPAARARTDLEPGCEMLAVASGEKRFGEVWLGIADAELWAKRVNAIAGATHA